MNEENKTFIEIDADTADEDGHLDGGLYPYDPSFTDIEMGEAPFSIFEYLRKYEQNRIITQPDFQRNLVWSNQKKSQFIESIILNFPIPPIYLNQTKEGDYMIIDGLQRTTSLIEFYNGKFALSGLDALPKYNGLYFKDLPEYLQSKFEDKKLAIFILKPSTPMVVIYDLFNRINTGGTQLNRQEVRNCIFIGKSTRLLKELSEQEYFGRAIDWGIKSTRMKDREAVLRYLSFRWFDFKKEYNGNMSDFIESAMKRINTFEESSIDRMKKDFERVMVWSFKIWEYDNFRIPTARTRGTINTAILETVCNYLSYHNDNFIMKNVAVIRRNYDKLLLNDTYFEAVTKSTGNKNKVLDRFKVVHEILNQDTHA